MFWRIVCIAAGIYLWTQYKENPNVIWIALIICFIFFIFIGDDEIHIYSDRVVQKDLSIASIFLNKKSFSILDISSASLPEIKASDPPPDAGDMIVIVILLALLPRRRNTRDDDKKFYLNLKNDTTVTITTCLSDQQVKEIVDTINRLR